MSAAAPSVRILILGANPSDTTRLSLAREVREIDQRLQASEHREAFRIEQAWAVRATDLQLCLLRHRPTIVHFSGHGNSAGELLFEDEAGAARPVSPIALGDLFRVLRKDIRCILLNACFSEAQARALVEHIDCVVGMTAAVHDRSAVAFAGAFYQALGFGEDVQTAFDLGCNQMDLARAQVGLRDLSSEADEASTAQADVPRLLVREGIRPQDIRFGVTTRDTLKLEIPANTLASNEGGGDEGISFSSIIRNRLPDLDGYTIIRSLAVSSSAVLLAEDDRLHRRVVIKALDISHLGDDERSSLVHDARRLASVHHVGIVALYDMIGWQDIAYLIMEYAEGNALNRHISERHLSDEDADPSIAVKIISRISTAVGYAHDHGIIHGQLNPSRIIMSHTCQPRIIGFYLGPPSPKFPEATYLWAPPEWYRRPRNSRSTDCRTDIYSIGAMMYQLLTGYFPPLPPLLRREENDCNNWFERIADPGLRQVCRTCMALNPDDRYPTVRDLVQDLRSCKW